MFASALKAAAAVRLSFGERLIGSILTCAGATLCKAMLTAAVIRLHTRSFGAGLPPHLIFPIQGNPPLFPRGWTFALVEVHLSFLRLFRLSSFTLSSRLFPAGQ